MPTLLHQFAESHIAKFCKETRKPGPCKGQKRGQKQAVAPVTPKVEPRDPGTTLSQVELDASQAAVAAKQLRRRANRPIAEFDRNPTPENKAKLLSPRVVKTEREATFAKAAADAVGSIADAERHLKDRVRYAQAKQNVADEKASFLAWNKQERAKRKMARTTDPELAKSWRQNRYSRRQGIAEARLDRRLLGIPGRLGLNVWSPPERTAINNQWLWQDTKRAQSRNPALRPSPPPANLKPQGGKHPFSEGRIHRLAESHVRKHCGMDKPIRKYCSQGKNAGKSGPCPGILGTIAGVIGRGAAEAVKLPIAMISDAGHGLMEVAAVGNDVAPGYGVHTAATLGPIAGAVSMLAGAPQRIGSAFRRTFAGYTPRENVFSFKEGRIGKLAERRVRKYCGPGKPGPCKPGETPVGEGGGTYQRAGQPMRSSPASPIRPGQGNVTLGRSLKNVAIGTGLVAKAAGKVGLGTAKVAAKALGTGAKVGWGVAKGAYKAGKWLKDNLSTQQITIQAKPKPLPPPRVVTSNFWSQGPAQQIVAPGKAGPAPVVLVPGWGRKPKKLAEGGIDKFCKETKKPGPRKQSESRLRKHCQQGENAGKPGPCPGLLGDIAKGVGSALGRGVVEAIKLPIGVAKDFATTAWDAHDAMMGHSLVDPMTLKFRRDPGFDVVKEHFGSAGAVKWANNMAAHLWSTPAGLGMAALKLPGRLWTAARRTIGGYRPDEGITTLADKSGRIRRLAESHVAKFCKETRKPGPCKGQKRGEKRGVLEERTTTLRDKMSTVGQRLAQAKQARATASDPIAQRGALNKLRGVASALSRHRNQYKALGSNASQWGNKVVQATTAQYRQLSKQNRQSPQKREVNDWLTQMRGE